MSQEKNDSNPGLMLMGYGAWAWIVAGLLLGAILGRLYGHLPTGIGLGSVLGIVFAFAVRGRRHQQ